MPGGQINPDLLRLAVRGRQVTSYKSIKTDMVNAGGHARQRSAQAKGEQRPASH